MFSYLLRNGCQMLFHDKLFLSARKDLPNILISCVLCGFSFINNHLLWICEEKVHTNPFWKRRVSEAAGRIRVGTILKRGNTIHWHYSEAGRRWWRIYPVKGWRARPLEMTGLPCEACRGVSYFLIQYCRRSYEYRLLIRFWTHTNTQEHWSNL